MVCRLLVRGLLLWRACCRRSVVPRRTRQRARLKVYLDCNDCFGDFIREEVDIVEYVRDPAEADMHVHRDAARKPAAAGASGRLR